MVKFSFPEHAWKPTDRVDLREFVINPWRSLDRLTNSNWMRETGWTWPKTYSEMRWIEQVWCKLLEYNVASFAVSVLTSMLLEEGAAEWLATSLEN